MTLPTTIHTALEPATADELRAALGALFDQFPSHNSADPAGKYAGYLDALSGEPKWAVENAVRRFLKGQVSSHDGHWLPTSAELARVVREESATARRMAEREAPRPMLTDQRITMISREKREENYRRFKELAETLSPARAADEPDSIEPIQAEPVGKHLVEALAAQSGRPREGA